MKRLKFIQLFTFAILLVVTSTSFAKKPTKESTDKTIKILTIGNSFADNACTYLKQIAESVDGCNLIYGKANIGGCFLEKHARLIKECEQNPDLKPYNKGKSLKEWLLEDEWDIVTIQQVSHLSFKADSYQPYADEICEYVKKLAPQAKIYVHETWAYAPDCPRLEGFGIDRKEMHKRLKKNYKVLAKRYDSPILPSGDAFYMSYKKNDDYDLWNPKDRFHANSAGCYLAGCTWFGKLFDRSPEEVSFVPEGMNAETAAHLRKIAAKQ